MQSHPSGTLGRYLRDSTASAIDSLDPGVSVNVWSNEYASPLVPNTGLWTPTRPTSPVWKHPAHGRFNGCLITPKHVVTARHTSVGWAGVNFRFAAADGTVCDRVSVDRAVIDGTDIAITTLNADVDAGVTPAKLAPANILSIINGRYRQPVPSVCVVRASAAYMVPLHWETTTITHAPTVVDQVTVCSGYPLDAPYSSWAQTPTFGDSGSPWYAVVDGTWCLLGCLYASVCAPLLAHYIDAIKVVTGVGYEPEVADFSGFGVPENATPEAEPPIINVPFPTYTAGENNMASVTAYPTSIVLDDYYGGGGLNYGNPWTNPNNAAVEDGVFATETAVGGSDGEGPRPMNAVGFDFSAIPDDATIDGFVVEIKDRRSTTGYRLFQGSASDRVSLVRASGEYGSGYRGGHTGNEGDHIGFSQPPTSECGTTLGWRVWGSASNLFGRSWTVAQIKGNAHFGCKHMFAWEYQGGPASVYSRDSMRITVHFTEAAPAGYPAIRGQRFIPHTPGYQRRIGA